MTKNEGRFEISEMGLEGGTTEDGVLKDGCGGKFDGRAGRQAAGQAGNFDIHIAQEGMDVEGGAVAFKVGVGGHDDFGDAAGADAFDEGVDGQIVRLDAFQRGDVAVEDVINPAAQAGLFEADDVFGLLDDTDDVVLAAGVGADAADLRLGQVEANAALADVGLDIADGLGQGEGLFGVGFEDVKRQPFGGLGADAGQGGELLNQFIQTFGIGRVHGLLCRFLLGFSIRSVRVRFRGLGGNFNLFNIDRRGVQSQQHHPDGGIV